ncbi:unnamed protein product, partial [Effrenium voratum]
EMWTKEKRRKRPLKQEADMNEGVAEIEAKEGEGAAEEEHDSGSSSSPTSEEESESVHEDEQSGVGAPNKEPGDKPLSAAKAKAKAKIKAKAKAKRGASEATEDNLESNLEKFFDEVAAPKKLKRSHGYSNLADVVLGRRTASKSPPAEPEIVTPPKATVAAAREEMVTPVKPKAKPKAAQRKQKQEPPADSNKAALPKAIPVSKAKARPSPAILGFDLFA